MSPWTKWKYKNLTFFAISLIFAFFLARYEPFHNFLLGLHNYGYISAFFAGMMYVSTFTVATGAVIILILAESLSPLELGIIAGIGGVVGDFIIFKFVKDNLSSELTQIYEQFDEHHHLKHVLHTKYFSWTLPVIGAVIMASPFPDEIGVSLMGISKLKNYQFLIISFILNLVAIFLIISVSNFIKP